MIKIRSQDRCHQYDESDNIITTWDKKKCSWIINPEYENSEIDWWGEDNDFPQGIALADFIKDNPNWNKLPDIIVIWTWNTKEGMMKALKDNDSSWYNKQRFPYSESRSWGYLEYTKEEAIEQLGKYCDFYKHADNTKIIYNQETIFNGKLK